MFHQSRVPGTHVLDERLRQLGGAGHASQLSPSKGERPPTHELPKLLVGDGQVNLTVLDLRFLEHVASNERLEPLRVLHVLLELLEGDLSGDVVSEVGRLRFGERLFASVDLPGIGDDLRLRAGVDAHLLCRWVGIGTGKQLGLNEHAGLGIAVIHHGFALGTTPRLRPPSTEVLVGVVPVDGGLDQISLGLLFVNERCGDLILGPEGGGLGNREPDELLKLLVGQRLLDDRPRLVRVGDLSEKDGPRRSAERTGL